jgi:hypothetical protein
MSPQLWLARIPIRWNRLIAKNTRQFKKLEHVLVGKAGQFSGTCSAGAFAALRPMRSKAATILAGSPP